ncbi:MAG: S-methyl-5-thioribose-1-phosphate isomerase [Bacteroidia bacterium]|nr:S-methyl-5-thioribose-1-phosphate isomerase [Bacteroidia bacterium]
MPAVSLELDLNRYAPAAVRSILEARFPAALRRTLWVHPEDPETIQILDQRLLPHRLVIVEIRSAAEAAAAIREMWVRGAPLIGITAAYGVYLACLEARWSGSFPYETALRELREARPTAVNLAWALDHMAETLHGVPPEQRPERALEAAGALAEADVAICHAIGMHGLALLREAYARTGRTVQILTHCNAGRLACMEWGTATAPIYLAHQAGIPVHVWVDETRPRNQGASLTAWELGQAGIPHTVIADNAGGHLMQHGQVDLCIVGTDRTTRTGDVANKIGTYLKALAARDCGVPFYVALPSPTIDWTVRDGLAEIPIEIRSESEVLNISGFDPHAAQVREVRLTPPGTAGHNPAFDVTPARLVTGLITERGIAAASEAGLLSLFPERR